MLAATLLHLVWRYVYSLEPGAENMCNIVFYCIIGLNMYSIYFDFDFVQLLPTNCTIMYISYFPNKHNMKQIQN